MCLLGGGVTALNRGYDWNSLECFCRTVSGGVGGWVIGGVRWVGCCGGCWLGVFVFVGWSWAYVACCGVKSSSKLFFIVLPRAGGGVGCAVGFALGVWPELGACSVLGCGGSCAGWRRRTTNCLKKFVSSFPGGGGGGRKGVLGRLVSWLAMACCRGFCEGWVVVGGRGGVCFSGAG